MITPQPQAKQLAKALGLNAELYLKREDLHPYGSHKGRSIPLMIGHYASQGQRNFCISSSGNAALAAIFTVNDLNQKNPDSPLTLQVFVGKHIPKDKLERLRQAVKDVKSIAIAQVDKPKKLAFQMDKENKAKNLRQSNDDLALAGYQTLADELAEIPNLTAVFIPTSSGTAAQGLHNAFKKLGLNPQIHIVQTPACHPMIEDSLSAQLSMASAIVDKIAFRKQAVQKAIKDSEGKGWIATDEDILMAQKLAKETENLAISTNSALSLAGLSLALQKNWPFDGSVVCVFTGR